MTRRLPNHTITFAAWCCVRLSVLTLAAGFSLTGWSEERVESTAFSDSSSDSSTQPYYFTIPAPRGQILDCRGRALARTVVVHRLMLRVPNLKQETPEAFVEWVDANWTSISQAYPEVAKPDPQTLRQHFEHRRRLPMPISSALRGEMEEIKAGLEGVEVQTEYARDYPGGSLAAHVVGYVTTTGAPLKGPLQYGEPLWRPIEGREGLEASMNAELTGQPGLLLVCYDKEGRMTQRRVMSPPVPGRDVVTTIDLEVQAAAEKALAGANRPGSMVVVDASTGSLLALASAPTFNPNAFAAGIDQESFEKLKADGDQPLFHRAISALYPPGSVFKPFVALASLREGRVNSYTRIPCGPELTIEGRKFRNWSDTDQGWFDLNSAIVRSCNTYFYQAAITTGDQPILTAAREFGFGSKISLPLAGVAPGFVPDRVPTMQAQANLAIGQSPILASPLDVAMAMAALEDGARRPRARLVSQVQSQQGEVLSATAAAWDGNLSFAPQHLATVHSAMYSVVNHREGTATKARVKSLPVYGKTGTAQWAREGEMVNAVWFAGFVKDSQPPLAFAVSLEGRKGEKLFGGSAAAPLAGQVLNSMAAAPAKYGMRMPKMTAPLEDYALGNQSEVPIPAYALTLTEPMPGTGLGSGYNFAASMPLAGAIYESPVPVQSPIFRAAPPEYSYPQPAGRVIATPRVSARALVPPSALPGATYTPRSSYGNRTSGAVPAPTLGAEASRRVEVTSPYADMNRQLPPGYEIRYESPYSQQGSPYPGQRVRRFLSFPVR